MLQRQAGAGMKRKFKSTQSKAPNSYSPKSRFINRELSWLEFNDRVLDEARDRKNPLMERLSFLSITQSNLDEFFMVRVASLRDQEELGYYTADGSGLTPADQLQAICERTHVMANRMYSTYNRMIRPALQAEGFYIRRPEELTGRQKELVKSYFNRTVYPILTPMAVDSSRPFPLISNKEINLAILLRPSDDKKADPVFTTIQVPGGIPRIFVLEPEFTGKKEKRAGSHVEVILLEDIISMCLGRFFTGHDILAAGCYRIMRNADLELREEDTPDLLDEIEHQLRLRERGEVIKLEIDDGMNDDLLAYLIESLAVDPDYVYPINGPLDLTVLNKFRSLPGCKKREDLYYPDFRPCPVSMYEAKLTELRRLGRGAEAGEEPAEVPIFEAIGQGDIFMYHPYESFDPVLHFIKEAAHDPKVLAIKQTLYRISGNSPIITYLMEAAENGKQVFVLVELKARFDEENNIHWARALEKAGCHVVYGLLGLKTHSKITLVVREEADGIRRYVHLGTGNYNDQTARIYTDMGIFTCRPEYGEDATEFFNMLSGFSQPDNWQRLIPAPLWMRKRFNNLIDREIKHAQAGRPAGIIAKMNSLVDEKIIDKLYEASQAGVQIDLIVRGICCLRPGVPGLSDQIRVRSLVGRYLEHARIYYFTNGGSPDLYLSSADWMPRNLNRRIELLFPVEDETCFARVKEILDLQLADNIRAHLGQPDGSYRKPDLRGVQSLDSQVACCRLAIERSKAKQSSAGSALPFIPLSNPVTES